MKAREIDVTERVLSEDQEDVALMAAMEEGLKSGIATEQEKNDFESRMRHRKEIYRYFF